MQYLEMLMRCLLRLCRNSLAGVPDGWGRVTAVASGFFLRVLIDAGRSMETTQKQLPGLWMHWLALPGSGNCRNGGAVPVRGSMPDGDAAVELAMGDAPGATSRLL